MNFPKYRGLKFNNEWAYGTPVKNPTRDTLTLVKSITEDDIIVWIVKPETLGQFTTLHDKNKTEIYQGDRLSFYTPDRVDGIVVFEAGAFMVQFEDISELLYGWHLDGIVNGNIYQQPRISKRIKHGL